MFKFENLGEQLRRSSLAIPTNIAEGTGRNSIKEANHFYNIAKGSTYETVSLMVIIKRRRYCTELEFKNILEASEEIAKMLSGLIKKHSFQ